MKLSLARVALLWWSAAAVVDASSQYRNPNGSRRRRSAIHRDDYTDADYHRSLSSAASWEGGSGYSSSPSLNYDEWDIDESSSFYDFEDLETTRKKKKRKRDSMQETERVLQALERSSRDEEEQRKRSKRKKSRRKTSSNSSPSPKSSKKKRRRRKKEVPTKVPGTPSVVDRSDKTNVSRTRQAPFPKRAFVPKTSSETRKPPKAAASTATKSSSSSSSAKRQTPQPQSHPDRTTWEVPSYSHKVSTMMHKKKSESKTKPRPATESTLPTAATTNQASNSRTGGVTAAARSTVATAAATRSARRTKPAPTTQTAQSSTLGSSTTPWVRKFLAARPKDRLLPLPRDYISDNFNLAQLPPIVERIGYQAMGDDAIPVAKALQQLRMEAAASGESQQPTRSSSYPIYRRALRSILADPSDEEEETSDEDLIIPPFAIQKAAEALYLMLHARFVISPRGLEAIRHVMALDNTVFGKCPRSCCKGTGLLPYGYSNDYTSDASVPTVTTESRKEHDSCCHRYCPSCGEVWISWESKTDGCAWGPSWCHLFLLAYGSQVYAKELEAAAAASQTPPPQPQTQTPTPVVRSFLQRRGTVATTTSNNSGSSSTSENLSRPTPSVFGFRIHPSTDFGRPFNEASLRGGSND